MTKFGAAENEMERLTAKFAQRTPTEHSLLYYISLRGHAQIQMAKEATKILTFPYKKANCPLRQVLNLGSQIET